jgi:hypothetical protein
LTLEAIAPLVSVLSVSQRLSEHPEGDRLHKLLYWVVKGRWESAAAILNQAPINGLLQELLEGTPTLTDLELRLYKAASKLNRPEKYRQIAELMVSGCRSFYAVASSKAVLHNEMSDLMTGVLEPDESESTDPITRVSKADRFEVRQFLMQQIPPLKAKILIFSLLRHPFADRPLDWMELKAKSLDSWIAELLHTFPVRQELEAKLFDLVPQIQRLDQGAQVAEAIAQSARLLRS